MGWLGKILGGSLGYLVGGPLGAVAGAALGHGFDAVAEQERTARAELPGAGGELSDNEQRQLAFFVSTFSMLAKLAKADGVVSREELQVIEIFMERDLELSPEARRFAIEIFNEAKDSDESFEGFARHFRLLFHDRPEMLRSLLDLLISVALADGVLHPAEERLIAAAAHLFGVPLEEFEQRKRAAGAGDDLERDYALLGVRPEDPLPVIKKRFRALAQEYHPDRVISKGMPEEFVKVATEKFQEIHAAYERIKAARGA